MSNQCFLVYTLSYFREGKFHASILIMGIPSPKGPPWSIMLPCRIGFTHSLILGKESYILNVDIPSPKGPSLSTMLPSVIGFTHSLIILGKEG